MSHSKKVLLALCLVFFCAGLVNAQEIETADFHAKDFKWFQFNLMKSVDNKIPFGLQDDAYHKKLNPKITFLIGHQHMDLPEPLTFLLT